MSIFKSTVCPYRPITCPGSQKMVIAMIHQTEHWTVLQKDGSFCKVDKQFLDPRFVIPDVKDVVKYEKFGSKNRVIIKYPVSQTFDTKRIPVDVMCLHLPSLMVTYEYMEVEVITTSSGARAIIRSHVA